MCENLVGLVEIGGMLFYFFFFWGGGGEQKAPIKEGGGLHVTCYAHFQTWPSYFRQKSFVKIWFRLVEAFKSYRGNIKKKKTRSSKHYPHGKFFLCG